MSVRRFSAILAFLMVVAYYPHLYASQEDEGTTTKAEFESLIEDYIRLFPYQATYKYAQHLTGRTPARLNNWLAGTAPVLVKAGADRMVRPNNDTFYKMAFVDLSEGPVYLEATVMDKTRFVSFQLMDDRNANYHNVMYPNGEFTLYHEVLPDQVRGESIAVPSSLSVVLVRVEVKDVNNSIDVASATDIFNGIKISGPTPSKFPSIAMQGSFGEGVVSEGNRRIDEAFKTIAYRETVVAPGKEPGRDVPYLNHAAGTKGGWGGPDPSHSSYEAFFKDQDGNELRGSKGTYKVKTSEPQVDAFWSITVYDTERGGFLHPNKYDRYHINNTTVVTENNGSIVLTFKQACEASDLNCLEVPPGSFDLGLRYYLPHEEIQTGSWTFPLVELQLE